MLAFVAPLLLGAVAAQEPASPPAAAVPAPRPAPVGRRFVLAENTVLHFSVPTNGGTIAGTIPVRHVEARGLEGWGRFEVVVVVDTERADTDRDAFWDRFVRETVLRGSRGDLTVTSEERLPTPPAAEGEEAPPGKLVARTDRRGAEAMTVTYRWEGDATSGTLHVEHAATLKALGLAPLPHPFLRAEGPVTVRLQAKLVRGR